MASSEAVKDVNTNTVCTNKLQSRMNKSVCGQMIQISRTYIHLFAYLNEDMSRSGIPSSILYSTLIENVLKKNFIHM